MGWVRPAPRRRASLCHQDLRVDAHLAKALADLFFVDLVCNHDDLGRLGFEAAVARDYPVIFGTLFAFGLVGLLVGILSDLMYVFVDPRIDFVRREA